MAESKEEICNMALAHLNVGVQLTSFDDDDTPEARALRLFYNTILDDTLRSFPWKFAQRITTLTALTDNPDEYDDEWDYAYRYPADAVKISRVQSGSGPEDTEDSRISYQVIGDADGQILFTSTQDAVLHYTARVTDTTIYPPDFTLALSFRLAHFIAPNITGGDQFKLGDRALQNFFYELSKARANDLNERQGAYTNESSFTRSRV